MLDHEQNLNSLQAVPTAHQEAEQATEPVTRQTKFDAEAFLKHHQAHQEPEPVASPTSTENSALDALLSQDTQPLDEDAFEYGITLARLKRKASCVPEDSVHSWLSAELEPQEAACLLYGLNPFDYTKIADDPQIKLLLHRFKSLGAMTAWQLKNFALGDGLPLPRWLRDVGAPAVETANVADGLIEGTEQSAPKSARIIQFPRLNIDNPPIESIRLEPRPKRGRPAQQAASKKKKNGRPKKLNTLENGIAIMAARVALDFEATSWTSMQKRDYLAKYFHTSKKTIARWITELNKRAARGEVSVCLEAKEVSFITQAHLKTALLDEALGLEPTVFLGKVDLKPC